MIFRYLEQVPAVLRYYCEAAPPYPDTIQLEVTNRCNLHCLFCPLTTLKRHRPFPSRDLTADDLATQKSLFKSASAVELTGFGELFAHPDPIGILSALRAYNLALRATTNGLLLTPKLSGSIVQNDLLDVIAFSIDAADEKTYRTIRGGNWDRLNANLAALNETKKKLGEDHPAVWFSFLAMRRNIEQLPNFVRFASKHGARKVIIQHLTENQYFKGQNCFHDRQLLGETLLKAQAVAEKENVFLDVRNLDPSTCGAKPIKSELFEKPAIFKNANLLVKDCPFPWEHVFIQADGAVSACAMVWELLDMGNLHTHSFETIWHGESYRKLRRSMIYTDAPDACVFCNYFGWRKPTEIKDLGSFINMNDGENSQLGIGWHPPDKDSHGKTGRWTKKIASAFLKNNGGRLLRFDVITHEGGPFLSGSISLQSISCDSESPPLKPVTFRFDSHDFWGLPLSLALPKIAGDIIKVEIRLDDTWNPSNHIAVGFRNIGLFVYSIEQKKAKGYPLTGIEPEDPSGQLAQGWLPVEKVNDMPFRWIGKRATALLATQNAELEIEARCPQGLLRRTIKVLIDGCLIGENQVRGDGKVHLLRFSASDFDPAIRVLEIVCDPATPSPNDAATHPRLFGIQIGKIAFQ